MQCWVVQGGDIKWFKRYGCVQCKARNPKVYLVAADCIFLSDSNFWIPIVVQQYSSIFDEEINLVFK